MPKARQQLGALGEQAAAEFLLNSGYEILERNYRTLSGELDIVAWAAPVLVFVEVKARSSYAFGYAEEAVDQRKQEAWTRSAEEYLLDHDLDDDIRFDIISVHFSRNGSLLELCHFTDAIG